MRALFGRFVAFGVIVVGLGMTGTIRTVAAAPPTSVTGSGAVLEGDVFFWTSIAAHEEDGTAWGTMDTGLDLTAFGLGITNVSVDVDCVSRSGSEAWVSGIIRHSTNPDVIPEGLTLLTYVKDNGNSGDVMHSEIEVGVCTDRPALPESTVLHGNFKVK